MKFEAYSRQTDSDGNEAQGHTAAAASTRVLLYLLPATVIAACAAAADAACHNRHDEDEQDAHSDTGHQAHGEGDHLKSRIICK